MRLPPRSSTLAVLLFVLAFGAFATSTRAESANPYAARGRTVISGGVESEYTGLSRDNALAGQYRWSSGGHLTLVHFIVDRFAIGGTVIGGGASFDGDTQFNYSSKWFGGDLDTVLQIPMSARLSLRFWTFGGVRAYHTHERYPQRGVDVWTGDGDPSDTRDERSVWFRGGFSPELLFHLSSSTALAFGPNLSLDVPLSDDYSTGFDLRLGPTLSYSFGPDDDQGGTRLEPAGRFSARGRNALTLNVAVSGNVSGAAGFVRFVRHGLGLGAYGFGGQVYLDEDGSWRAYAGLGVQALTDLALVHSLSLMTLPQLGYAWRRGAIYRPESDPAWGLSNGRQNGNAHELHATLPIYLALHLYESLVFGVGPVAALTLRASDSSYDRPSELVWRGGVSSVLLGSF